MDPIAVLMVWLRYQEYLRRLPPRRRRSPAVWVKKYLTRRPQASHYHTLIRELGDPTSIGHAATFQNYFRMDGEMFLEILEVVGPIIEKSDTDFR